MKVHRVQMIKDAVPYINTVGQIVGKRGQNLIIKTVDTVIEIVDYEFSGKLKIGDRFV